MWKFLKCKYERLFLLNLFMQVLKTWFLLPYFITNVESSQIFNLYVEMLLSLLNGALACSRALHAWRGHVLGVVTCFTCSCASVLGVLQKIGMLGVLQNIGVFHKMACLACFEKLACFACFIKWRTWRVS